MITLKNVVKKYSVGENQIHALRGISLELEQGAYVSIVGPSGSGKSTLFQVIGGLEPIDEGEIWVAGQPVHQLKEAELARLRREQISFVFQQFQLLPTATALENVMMPLLGFSSSRMIRKRAEEALELVGLGQRMGHLPTRLSGGEQQRVAIARALVTRPQIILADEPTGNLDSENGANIIRLLEEFHQRDGGTLIVITHDQSLANRAKKKIHLLDGQIKRIESEEVRV
jgi:putative ABC transport system ATP-binding protein